MNTSSAPPSGPRSALRTRLRIYSAVGLAILGAWLYYTVNTVLSLYDVTLAIEQSTDLKQRVLDAQGGLKDSEESLERYISGGQGYDLSRHHIARTSMRTALGAIRRRATTVGSRGSLERAESAEEIYSRAADRAIAAWNPDQPAAARQIHDDLARPAADKLREFLSELEARFARSEAFAEERLKDSRDSAARAIGVLAILIIVGIFWILSDVGRRIVVPWGPAPGRSRISRRAARLRASSNSLTAKRESSAGSSTASRICSPLGPARSRNETSRPRSTRS